MSNDYYNATGTPGRRSFAASQPIESEYDLLEQGFDKFPTFTLNYMMVGDGTKWTAKSPTQVRTTLGATTIGSALFTLTNPSAVTFPQFNADNSVTALTAAQLKSALNVITTVTGTGTIAGITLTGTGSSGTVTLTLGGTLRVDLTTQVTNVLPIANGGTGASDAATARTNLSLGTMSTQNKDAVDILGGNIQDTNIYLNAEAATISGGVLNLDLSIASVFRVTVNQNFAVSISGAPSDPNQPVPFRLIFTNAGSYNVTGITGSGFTIWKYNASVLAANAITVMDCMVIGTIIIVETKQLTT